MTIFVDQPKLLAGYRNAERDAMQAIFHRYVDEVAALALRGFIASRPRVTVVSGTPDPAEQNDIIQETFLRVFSETARSGYDSGMPFKPYLLRITKNLLIDRLRRLQRRGTQSSPDPDDLTAIGENLLEAPTSLAESDPAEQAHWQRQLEATTQYLDRLAEPEKTFYQLRYQQGLPQDEVAHRMEITRRRVRTLEERLRKCVRKHLVRAKLWP